jgi:nicotinamide riboside kinase
VKTPIKIAFTGPESSGKSTLASWLSEEINGAYCQEFAREYLSENKMYVQDDLVEIAKGQLNIWQSADAKKPLIADTELVVIEIWSKWKYKSCDDFIISNILKQDFDFYFLCKPDIPWVYDPLRETPNDREELYQIYYETLSNYKFNFFILEGNLVNRQKLVKQVLRDYGLVF